MTCKVNADTTNGLKLTSDTSGEIDLQTNGTTKVHMESSGNVGIGTSNPSYNLDVQSSDQTNIRIHNTGTENSFLRITTNSTSASSGIVFGDVDDIDVGTMIYDHANNYITWKTNADEHMRLNNAGDLIIGDTLSEVQPGFNNNTQAISIRGGTNEQFFISSSSNPMFVNRTVDGSLVVFRSAGNSEGNISVSGSTVSYNGGHLSRWGRLSDNSQPTILKGTVMSNLDEMVVWEVDGVEVENEQRNQLKISDVEGDINVAGLFVKWDTEEDGYNDIDLAMTGDMIIRIAQGTTVQRGDLLMSAGDGTAKPQGDDIVRSKTIAKVTSTTVINTYDDGSYVVPCVVMAC
jgi:hypothetical protein